MTTAAAKETKDAPASAAPSPTHPSSGNSTLAMEMTNLQLLRRMFGFIRPVRGIATLTVLVILLSVLIDNRFQPPLWIHALLWVPFTFIAAVVMLRWIKAGLIAQQFRVRRLEHDQ